MQRKEEPTVDTHREPELVSLHPSCKSKLAQPQAARAATATVRATDLPSFSRTSGAHFLHTRSKSLGKGARPSTTTVGTPPNRQPHLVFQDAIERPDKLPLQRWKMPREPWEEPFLIQQ